MRERLVLLILAGVIATLLAGCFPGEGNYSDKEPAGFFTGIWHGWIAPLSLLIGLFNHTTRIYEVHNAGWWYDLGYYVAVIGGFGGVSLFRRSKHKKRKSE